jgi:hypothetical protein
VPAKRKKRFYKNCDSNKQEAGFILFKYSKLKLKNQKPISVDVFFKAYPMVPLSCRSNLAGR